MGDDQNRGPGAVELHEQVEDPATGDAVQVAGGLIGQHQRLSDLAQASLDAHADAIAAGGLSVRTALAPVTVTGDRILLARMVDNLIDNAVRHNQAAGWIRVLTQRNGVGARVTVESGGAPLFYIYFVRSP